MPKKDPKRVAIGRLSKRKGRAFEQKVAKDLRPIFGEDVYRGHQDRRGGSAGGEGADIENTPFYCECRHEANYNWRRHLRETLAKREERKDNRPVLLVAKDGKKPPGWRIGQLGTPVLAIMLWDDLLELLGRVYTCKNEN